MRSLRLVLIAVLVFALGACSQEADTPATANDAAIAASAATAASQPPAANEATPSETADATADAALPMPDLGEFRIVSVLVGNAVDGYSLVITDNRSFTPKDTIYASVLSSGKHQGLRLSAKWLAPDGTQIADSSQPVVPTAGTATTFSIKNPEPWPVGDYQVLIGINGQTQRTETFSIR
jgi:hypothetical protein